jgi:AcrR family transcriptional regulator
VARTTGSRNANYEEQRLTLARQVRRIVMVPGGPQSSLRDMASAAAVSVATLRHYFQDREGVLTAVLESQRIDAAPYLAGASMPPPRSASVRSALLTLLMRFKDAWFQHGVGKVYAASLEAGLSASRLGPAYVESILEPLLQMGEGCLRRHVERGELGPLNERFAALELLSPVLLGLLHQDSLLGKSCRPLEVDRFLRDHVDRFVRAYLPTAKPAAKPAAKAKPKPPLRRSPR